MIQYEDFKLESDGKDSRMGVILAMVFAAAFWGCVFAASHYLWGWPF